ncbi:MAG: hypothetical protein AB7O66_15305 [Limisphaerales bacterium]
MPRPSPTRSPFLPPRAPWYAPVREVGHAALAATRITRIPTPGSIGPAKFLLGLLIPGFAFVLHQRLKIGAVLIAAWPVLFFLGLAFLGGTAGNLLLGLAMSIHATSIVHLVSPWLRDLAAWQRILASLASVGGLVVFGYLPLQELAYRKLFFPIISDQGAVVIRPTRDPAGIRRGDWIVHWLARYRGASVIIEEGTSFGPVLALPGETVEFTPTHLNVNGKSLPLQAGMPTDGSVSIPEGHWFVWARFGSIRNPAFAQGDLQSIRLDRSIVPTNSLRGRPYSRWFHRQQVLTTPP